MSDRAGRERVATAWVGRRARVGLAVVGTLSWLTGAVATFVASGGGSGAGALVLAGIACCAVALLGRWPTRLRVQGGELVWDDVDRTVGGQIEAARRGGEDAVVAELHELRDRLESLRDTGVVPLHPAEAYDREVVRALRRVAPDLAVLRDTERRRTRPDLVLQAPGHDVLVETKWRPASGGTFHGSTMRVLLDALPADARVLVVTNADDVGAGQAAIGPLHRVVAWRDASDDAALAAAVTELTQTSSAAAGSR